MDNNFIATSPSEQLLAGRVNGERIIAGSTAHEALMKTSFDNETFLLIPNNIMTEDDVKQYIRAKFRVSEEIISMIEQVYPDPSLSCGLYNDMQSRVAAISGEAIFNCPSYWLAQAFPSGHAYSYEWQSAGPS